MPPREVTLLMAMGAGLLSFLSPCVLPLFPSYLSFVAGVSLDDLQGTVANRETRRAVLLNSLLFIAGFSIVFISLGASFSLLGRFFFDFQWVIQRAGGVLIILLGLCTLGLVKVPWLMRDLRVHLKTRPAGYVGALLVGVTFAAGWIPCVGPILGAILVLASTTATAETGVLLLAAYSLGLAVPFLVSSLALNRFLKFFDRFKRFLPAVEVVSGVFLLFVGTLLVTNYFTLLSSYALKLTPKWLWERL